MLRMMAYLAAAGFVAGFAFFTKDAAEQEIRGRELQKFKEKLMKEWMEA